MKRRNSLLVALTGVAVATCMLAGCGASLDREVTVQSMTLKVPTTWLEQSNDVGDESRGSISFLDDSDRDDDKTGNSLIVSYERASRSAAEAMALKQAYLEQQHGVTAWSIDKEKTSVIDGAQVTVFEYSFVKDIEGVRQKYECETAYVSTLDMIYEIAVVGDKVNVENVVDSIEL